MRDDPVIVDLVLRARAGEQRAWDEIVERFAPLVWGICMRHRLSPADADDVGQSLWLGLLEHLQSLREPAALPGWIATTTRRECLRLHEEARRRRAMALRLRAMRRLRRPISRLRRRVAAGASASPSPAPTPTTTSASAASARS